MYDALLADLFPEQEYVLKQAKKYLPFSLWAVKEDIVSSQYIAGH